jgi:transcriptional regulator with XRE-family HTH domain
LVLIRQTGGVDDGMESVLNAVGPWLRALRRRRDITLTALAEQTGISTSTLSRLESGQRRPTLELLLPLARTYQIPIDELVGAPPTGDPRAHLRPVNYRGLTMVALTRRPGGVQAYKLIIPPACEARPLMLKTHEGYGWMYVLSGRLRLLLGDQDLVLMPGEAAEFDTRVPHWLAAPTPYRWKSLACLVARVSVLRYAGRHVPHEVLLAAWPGEPHLIERLLGPPRRTGRPPPTHPKRDDHRQWQ